MSQIRFVNLVERCPGETDLYRVEALRVGNWAYDGLEGGLDITKQLLTELSANFAAGVKGHEVPIDGPCRGGEAHSDDDKHDCGWVKRLDLSPDGSKLYAIFSITNPEVKGMVDEGSLRYVSSELALGWEEPESRRTMNVFEGLSLTNRPYLKRMEGIAQVDLSEPPRQHKEAPMPTTEELQGTIESLKAQLAEKSKGDSAQVAKLGEELTSLKAQLVTQEATEKRIAAAEASARQATCKLQLAEYKARFQAMVRKGKPIPPSLYGQFMRLAEALLGQGHETIVLSTKVKLAEGDAAVETDNLNVLDAMVDLISMLPDEMASPIDKEAILEEDKPGSGDDDEDDEKKAEALMSEKKISFTEAYTIVRRAKEAKV